MSGKEMDKKIIKSERLSSEYQVIKHASGLTINLCPMDGYSSAVAMFGTRYGSVDVTFKTKDDADYLTVPEGIAHYLEHKLFENEDCDAFRLFAKTGAYCNAYTGFDKTAYYFSCSREFKSNLGILLNFVQNPYFTDETIAKEQGIIGQEIRMYTDDPGWRVFFGCLCGVYHNNPVRIDIAGTEASIAKIDKDLLYRCYNTFYNLHNMTLSVAGNFDVEEVLTICDELLKPAPDLRLETVIPAEPASVKNPVVTRKLAVSQPLFNIGFKQPNYTGRESREQDIYINILFEVLLGDTSRFYNDAVLSGLISENGYHVGVLSGRGFFLPVVEGEAADPAAVLAAVKQQLRQAKTARTLPEKEFLNVKKKTYGELIKSQISVKNVATAMMNAFLDEGGNMFDVIEIAANVTVENCLESLGRIDEENCTVSIVEPT